jgi:hydrogenase maturation factor
MIKYPLFFLIVFCSCNVQRGTISVNYSDTIRVKKEINIPLVTDSIQVNIDSIWALMLGDSLNFVDTSGNTFVIKREVKDISIKHKTQIKPFVIDTTVIKTGTVIKTIKEKATKPEKTLWSQVIKFFPLVIAFCMLVLVALIILVKKFN